MAPSTPLNLKPLHAALLSPVPAINQVASNVDLVRTWSLLRDYLQRGWPLTPLQAAVMKGSYSLCKQLLREGADTTTACDIPPPLCIALDTGKFQIARLIIEAKADLVSLYKGVCPMFHAIKPNTPEFIVEAFIKAGFPPDSIIEERYSSTALHKAVICKNVNVVKALMKLKADCDVKEAQFGYTPLHMAVNAKVPLIMQMLVDNGADLEAEDKSGQSPLFHAILQNDLFLVNFLLEIGADVQHLCSKTLIYPLHLAAILGHVAIAKALIKHGADPSRVELRMANLPIHSVARSQNGKTSDGSEKLKDMTELLIEKGSEIDIPNKDGNTPLQLALKEQNFKVVEVLIKEGAAVNHSFEQGTNFHYAAKIGNKDLVNMFFEFGADYSDLDNRGNTPYHLAMFNRNPNVLNTFWKFGCPFDMPKKGSADGTLYPSEVIKKIGSQKKLMLGIKVNNVKMIVKALSSGAEVRSASVEIPYPLHYAVSNGFSSVVLLLLENGMPANLLNDEGETPLHIAASKGYFQIFRYLLRYGASYNSPSKLTRKTPLRLALENNQYEIVYILREIDLMFKTCATKSFEGMRGMFEKSKNVQSLQAYINSINRNGNTLFGVALKEKNLDLAENLIKLRLQIIKA